jgi:hypothetical protein
MDRSRFLLAPLAAAVCFTALAAGGGCRLLATPATTIIDGSDDAQAAAPISPSAPRPAPRTIPVELVFVRHLESDPQLTDELWQLADEQLLPVDVRRRLNANGLRVGVVSARLPPALAARFAAAGTDSTENTGLEPPFAETAGITRRTLRLLPGRENEIVSASGLAEAVLLERHDEGVRGGTYRDASAVFALRAWPAADGRVRMQIGPFVKHGPHERTWVGDDGAFRLETGQRRESLDGLRFEADVSNESVLLIGCAGAPASSVGDTFLRGHGGVRLVTLRPLARTTDPLFAAE